MKTTFEQRYITSIHTRHFGKTSLMARLMYGVLLILFALIVIVSNRVNTPANHLNISETSPTIEIAKQAFASRHATPLRNAD